MKTERILLNTYSELIKCLTTATICFKKKEDIIDLNRMMKEIRILNKRLLREQLNAAPEDLQMKIKFKKR